MRTNLWISMLFFGVPLMTTSYWPKAVAAREALTQALRGIKAAAYAEIDESQWTRQREQVASLYRLVGLPQSFWREFLPALGQIVGVPVRCETDDDRLERVVRRALKAELRKEATTECDDHSSAA